MKTLDDISLDKYGKTYKQLPDDGAEQDFVQRIYATQNKDDNSAGAIPSGLISDKPWSQ